MNLHRYEFILFVELTLYEITQVDFSGQRSESAGKQITLVIDSIILEKYHLQ